MKVIHFLQDAWLAFKIGLVLLFLSGCATTARVVDLPEPPVITAPEKPLISPALPPAEKVRLILDYVKSLEAALQEALAALSAYSRAPTNPASRPD